MQTFIGVRICPAAVNRHLHAVLTGRRLLVLKNSCLMSDHAVNVIVSVDGLSR